MDLSLPCVVFVCCVRPNISDMKKVDFYLQANFPASKKSANLHISFVPDVFGLDM